VNEWKAKLDDLKARAKAVARPLTPENFRQTLAARKAFDEAIKSGAKFEDAIKATASKIKGKHDAEAEVLGLDIRLALHESSGTDDIPAGWRWHLSSRGAAKKTDLSKILRHLDVPSESKIGDLPMATHWGWAANPEDVPS